MANIDLAPRLCPFSLNFTLISDPGDEGECADLGTAIIDLKAVEESDKDLEHASINGKRPSVS